MNKTLARISPISLLVVMPIFQILDFLYRADRELSIYFLGPAYESGASIFDTSNFAITNLAAFFLFLLMMVSAFLQLISINKGKVRIARLLSFALLAALLMKLFFAIAIIELNVFNNGDSLDRFDWYVKKLIPFWAQTFEPSEYFVVLNVFQFENVLTLILILAGLLILFTAKNSSAHSNTNHQQPVFQQPYAQQPVYQQPQYVQPPQPPVQESMTAQLAELERMFESGALTKTEFTAAKKRVLGS